MSEEKKKEISGVQIDEIVSQNPKTRIKSYLRLILLFLVLFGVLFIVGSFVPEFLVLFVFLLLMSAPVILLMRNKVVGILPDFIGNSLLEIDTIYCSPFLRVVQTIHQLIELTGASFVYLAIDGPAPKAKMIQQRLRRHKSALESKPWDTNAITPGTIFMNTLNTRLQQEFSSSSVVISDSTLPGEGEHKILQYIKIVLVIYVNNITVLTKELNLIVTMIDADGLREEVSATILIDLLGNLI